MVHHETRRALVFDGPPTAPAATNNDARLHLCVATTHEHIGVEARAGTGKTYLICEQAKAAN